jgi:protein TonB
MVNFSDAQTIYYDSLWEEIPSKTGAFYYREITHENGKHCARDFYISGKKQMEGCYMDSACKIKNGYFIYYDSNGKKTSEGTYVADKQMGDWKWYEEGEFNEKMPEFPGGRDAMLEFLNRELRYPEDAHRKGIEGRVVLQFLINTDGSITDIEIKKPVYPSLDKEAKRVISMMPPWKPGMQNDKPVPVKFTMPIIFRLK